MEKEKRKFNKNEGHDVKLSKALSYLLRHGAIEEGLKMNAAGYVKLDDVMKYLKEKKGYKNLHFKDIQAVVDTNDKKRFELNEEGKHICIRATQGHSIKEVSSE